MLISLAIAFLAAFGIGCAFGSAVWLAWSAVSTIVEKNLERFLLWFVQWLPRWTIHRRAAEPYLTRYYLLGRDGNGSSWGPLARVPFCLFLQRLHCSDDPEFHNHPYSWAASVILVRGYLEERMTWSLDVSSRRLRPGSVNIIRQSDFHRLEIVDGESWSLFLGASKHGRGWGFVDPVTFRYRHASGARR